MGIFEVMELFNIINVLNTMLPKGVGEVIVLMVWCGFFLLLGVLLVAWILTKEMILTNTRARATMEEIGIIVYPGGATREFILPRNSDEFKIKMGDKEATWTIKNDEWMSKSNGVRYTFFHPAIPHNVSLNSLIRTLQSSKTIKINENEEVEYIPIENITYGAFDQDAKVQTLAMAMKADMDNPLAQFAKFAPWIAIIFALTVCALMIVILFPKTTTVETVQTVAEVVTTITTTTLQAAPSQITPT